MIELNGKYNKAKVFTDNVEQTAISQIIGLCNEEFTKDSKIRIMPDCHAGAGCTIGTTMTIKDKVVPNLVGVDLGCGMFTVKLKEKNIDFEALDKIIRKYIPHGQNVRDKNHKYNDYVNLEKLYCKSHLNLDRARKSIGTLGGGNHFIEINIDSKGSLYLVIHSGSRYLGKQVAEYYQKQAIKYIKDLRSNREEIINQLKLDKKEKEIEAVLKTLAAPKVNDALCYLEGELFDQYLHDMGIAQFYAQINREAMADIILEKMNLNEIEHFTTIHNYIDLDNMILRKGAISSQKGEVVLIPMNMRDGSIIAIGKGNEDWNYSAPHGAGRILSRSKAKEKITLEEFQESMTGIWTSSVCSSTIDESPMTYKPMQEIIDNISETVEIIDVIKPLYNFKSSN